MSIFSSYGSKAPGPTERARLAEIEAGKEAIRKLKELTGANNPPLGAPPPTAPISLELWPAVHKTRK